MSCKEENKDAPFQETTINTQDGSVIENPDMPVWAFGNTSDTLFVSSGWTKFETNIQNCSNYINEFKLSVYQNTCGHGCWDSHWAKPEVQDWLINQSK